MPVLEGCFDSFSPYWPDRARGLPKRPPLGERSDGRDEDGGAALVAYSRGLGRAISPFWPGRTSKMPKHPPLGERSERCATFALRRLLGGVTCP